MLSINIHIRYESVLCKSEIICLPLERVLCAHLFIKVPVEHTCEAKPILKVNSVNSLVCDKALYDRSCHYQAMLCTEARINWLQ